MMDAHLKAKWVAALRSDEYSQVDGILHNEVSGGYCCLGVLCKVMGAEFGSVVEQREDGEWTSHDYVPHIGEVVLGADEELRPALCKEIGIPDQYVLIQMNDGDAKEGIPKHSFSEIADFIEKQL
jgi:hypothetical protein